VGKKISFLVKRGKYKSPLIKGEFKGIFWTTLTYSVFKNINKDSLDG